jgi:hypothetical protein
VVAKNLDLDAREFRSLVRDVEHTFRLRFDRDEVDKLKTAADIQAVLMRRFAGCSGRKCAFAMAFFRLRGALRRRGLKQITPGTDLRRLTRFKGEGWVDALEDDCGLRLPRTRARFLRWLGWVMAVPGVALWILAYHLGSPDGLYFIGFIVLIVAWRISDADFFELPLYCRHMGALTFIAVQLNYGRLVEQGARATPDDIWAVLAGLLEINSDLDEDEILPEAALRKP